jgi:hypothetical protein
MNASPEFAANGGGPCPSCGASLALDQRYCVECGHRLAAPLTLPYAAAPPLALQAGSGLPMPVRVVSILAAAALGFGVVVGTAMSTALDAAPVAHTMQVVQVPPSPPPAPPESGSESSGPPAELGPSAPSFNSPYAPGLLPSSGSYRVPKPKPPIINGVVAHVNTVAGSYSVANGGPLVAIHSKKLPDLGAKVRTPVRTLSNGTYAEDGKRKTRGHSNVASFTGTVTFRNDEQGKDYYSVSSRGSSVLVRVPPDVSGSATPPPFGSGVAVDVRLDPYTPPAPPSTTDTTTTTTTTPAPQPTPNACDADGEAVPATPPIQPTLVLTQTRVSVDQQSLTTADLEGIVQAVCPGSRQLVISADDTRESSQDIVLGVERGIDLTKIAVGRAIVGNATLTPPQSLSLASVASDQGIKGADNPRLAQTGIGP